MNTPDSTALHSRRDFLRYSAGALLAMGLWPGRLRAADNGKGESFTFIAVNDFHFHTPQCGPWCERVAKSMQALSPKPDICLMVGDLADTGSEKEIGSMRDALKSFGMPFYTVIGNHDYVSDSDRKPYETLCPDRLNYHFEHRGWNMIGLDTTQGTKADKTVINAATLAWMDEALPKLDRTKPTVLFTHFPMGTGVSMRPTNADALLSRLKEFNLVAVFNGHFHGFTERKINNTILTTNKCCSISRNNHDGTKEKGYFLCKAVDGQIQREFIEVKPA